YLDSIGSMFPIGRAIETAIPGTPQNFEEKQAEKTSREQGQAKVRQENALASQEESKAETLRNPPQKETTAEEQAFADLIKQGVAPLDAYRQVKQAGEKPQTPKAPEHFPAGEMVADPNAPGGFRQVGEKEQKPGEYKPYTVPGSKTPILAAQQG